jgi:hypothetical protein
MIGFSTQNILHRRKMIAGCLVWTIWTFLVHWNEKERCYSLHFLSDWLSLYILFVGVSVLFILNLYSSTFHLLKFWRRDFISFHQNHYLFYYEFLFGSYFFSFCFIQSVWFAVYVLQCARLISVYSIECAAIENRVYFVTTLSLL